MSLADLDLERFEVSAFTIYPGTADLQLRHRCAARTWAVHIQHPLTLAELVQRATQHTEECR